MTKEISDKETQRRAELETLKEKAAKARRQSHSGPQHVDMSKLDTENYRYYFQNDYDSGKTLQRLFSYGYVHVTYDEIGGDAVGGETVTSGTEKSGSAVRSRPVQGSNGDYLLKIPMELYKIGLDQKHQEHVAMLSRVGRENSNPVLKGRHSTLTTKTIHNL